MRIISSMLRQSKKKFRTPIVKMLTRSVTKAKGKWIVERRSTTRNDKRRRLQSEEGCEDPAHALANWRDARSPAAMTRMR